MTSSAHGEFQVAVIWHVRVLADNVTNTAGVLVPSNRQINTNTISEQRVPTEETTADGQREVTS